MWKITLHFSLFLCLRTISVCFCRILQKLTDSDYRQWSVVCKIFTKLKTFTETHRKLCLYQCVSVTFCKSLQKIVCGGTESHRKCRNLQKITETYRQNELFEISVQFLWISADYFLLGTWEIKNHFFQKKRGSRQKSEAPNACFKKQKVAQFVAIRCGNRLQCAKQTKNHRRRLSRQKTVGDWLSLDSAVFLRRRLSRRLSRFQAESKRYVGYCRL